MTEGQTMSRLCSVLVALAAGAALAATSLSFAQAPQRQERREARQEARRVKDILGSRITIQGGTAVGTVDDLVLSDDGYVEYLVVNSDGKYVLVPWEAARGDF